MASLRCEELQYGIARGPYQGDVSVPVIKAIGTANVTATPGASSGVIWGPAPTETSLFLRAVGGQYLVTKGPATPVVTEANGTLIDIGGAAELHLLQGESVAAMTAVVV